MFNTFEEAKNFIMQNDVKMIDFKMIDINGRWHHLTIPVERFDEDIMSAGIVLTAATTALHRSRRATWYSFRILRARQ